MARIPEAEIERLKKEVSIVRLVEGRGIKLTGKGDNLQAQCPFHDDRGPSLVVSPSKNLWHCLGACQIGGSVIDWVMKAEKVSFRLAVEMLRKDAPSLAAATHVAGTRPKLEEFADPEEPDAVVLRRVADYYHQTLKESPEALAYLEQRGLRHPELIDHFRLGFANRTLGYRLPIRQIKAGAAIRSQLERIGIYRESGHEHLSGSLVIPVFGEDGSVLELYGRKITDGLRKGTPLHLYLPHRETRGVFNLAAFKAAKEIILTEALIDALTIWCAGFRNVTSAYGVEGFTKEIREAFIEYGTEKVLIAFDRDEAGNKAAKKLATQLASDGMQVFRVCFPKGMDANEYALKVQPASKALETAIRSAEWMAGTRSVAVPQAIEDFSLAARIVDEPPADVFMKETTQPVLQPAEPIEPEPLDVEARSEELIVRFGDRKWRIRGLSKNTSYASLKVNLLVAQGDAFFVDTLEVYSARHRAAFLRQAAEEVGIEERILKSDLGKIILRLEDLVHQQIEKTLNVEKKVEMAEDARAAALSLLRDPRLFDRILADFDRAGVVGEETNKLVGYLAAVSRKLEAPLAVVIQSSSAAGKSSLMDAVLRFMPEEERVQYSAMTGQSLFYMGATDLAHKILAIAEEEGAQSAAYALKLLQSEGKLTIASTGKDGTTGRLVTHEYSVQGPVMIFLTTTAIEIDEELLNRCVVLTVDEGAKQTAAIHERQRSSQTLEGLLQRHDRDEVVKLHQNAQHLLRPVFVANPFAKELRFTSHATRTRRDHMKYLTLIRTIALLHQYQRPLKEVLHRGTTHQYIEVTKADIEMADRLAAVVLGHGLDELPPQTRRLLEIIEALVTKEANAKGIERAAVRFSRKDVRMATQWGQSALKKHLARLEDLEYLLVHTGGARRRFVYELANATKVANGREPGASGGGESQVAFDYDNIWSPPNGVWSPLGHPLITPGGSPEFLNHSAKKDHLVTVFDETHIGPASKIVPYTESLTAEAV